MADPRRLGKGPIRPTRQDRLPERLARRAAASPDAGGRLICHAAALIGADIGRAWGWRIAVTDWKHDGVRVVPADSLDVNTAQTPGMNRAAAINFARVGAQKLWAGTVHIHPDAKTGAHHHGALESVIYVVRGRARMRWGEALEFTAEANPGDFIFIPPYVPHQEINASPDEVLECVLVRSDNEAVVVNLDIEVVEKPETVRWIDPIHKT